MRGEGSVTKPKSPVVLAQATRKTTQRQVQTPHVLPTTLVLTGGEDWYDACVDVLGVPAGRDPVFDVQSYPGYESAGRRSVREWLVEDLGYATEVPGVVEMHDH
jgi:hypothetical protein